MTEHIHTFDSYDDQHEFLEKFGLRSDRVGFKSTKHGFKKPLFEVVPMGQTTTTPFVGKIDEKRRFTLCPDNARQYPQIAQLQQQLRDAVAALSGSSIH